MNLQQFYNDTLTNGGASFNILTGEYNPSNGYMLAIKGHELQVPLNSFNQKVLSDYIKSKSDILMSGITSDKFIGSWVNDGIVYLDCSVKYLTATQAIQTGIENGELAIWDNFLKASIPCNKLALEQAVKVDLINNI